ncbi:Transmembrane_domain-containing protein [Hexamita inflata]|uniref:Transmembrane domain-containing protein n=1 Tax=Hexamita inflata TaxID=28002 RepID=A0AA86UNS0_9EUKA|nr:Transmembrane domain-containing protein [Hexamita inflata]
MQTATDTAKLPQQSQEQKELQHDEDFRTKVKTRLAEQVLNGNQLILSLNLFVPQFVALLFEVIISFVSAYFQSKYFGEVYYESALYYLPYIQIVQKFLPYALAQMHAINVQKLIIQNKKEEIVELNNNHFRIQLVYGIILSIAGIVGIMLLKKFDAFQTYAAVQGIFQPICTAFSMCYSLIFAMENRRLLVISLISARPVIQIMIEAYAYSFYDAAETDAAQKLTTNFPTTLGATISYVLMAVWIVWLNYGKTMLGVTNLNEYPLKDVMKPINFCSKGFFKQFFKYSLALLSAITNIAYPVSIIVSVQDVVKVYKDADTIVEMQFKLFVFFYFGQIFRIAATSLNYMYTHIAINNQLAENFKRINSTLVTIIVLSGIVNVLLFFLMTQTNLIDTFSGTSHSISLTNTLLYAGLSGFGQTITEVVITDSIIDSSYVLLLVLPIFKFIQLFIGADYLKTKIGDEADFVMVLFFTEMNSTGCAVVILLINIVKNYLKNRKINKGKKKDNKKQSLDEQLAALK